MMKIFLVFIVVAFSATFAIGQKAKPYSRADGDVYDGRIEQVKGKVIYLNHPDLGKTPASGHYLVFQRDGCKDCLVALTLMLKETIRSQSESARTSSSFQNAFATMAELVAIVTTSLLLASLNTSPWNVDDHTELNSISNSF